MDGRAANEAGRYDCGVVVCEMCFWECMCLGMLGGGRLDVVTKYIYGYFQYAMCVYTNITCRINGYNGPN